MNYLTLIDEHVNLVTNAGKTIKELSKNYRLALATSENTETTLKVLDKFDLKQYFKAIITADMVTKTKPDPEVFLKAAKELNIQPEYCVVIEDSTFGVDAAKKAGMKSIGITTNLTKEQLAEADIVIDSFSKLDLKNI